MKIVVIFTQSNKNFKNFDHKQISRAPFVDSGIVFFCKYRKIWLNLYGSSLAKFAASLSWTFLSAVTRSTNTGTSKVSFRRCL